jgi:hypothetical protein
MKDSEIIDKVLLCLKDAELIAEQLTTGNVSHKRGQIIGIIRLCRDKLLEVGMRETK